VCVCVCVCVCVWHVAVDVWHGLQQSRVDYWRVSSHAHHFTTFNFFAVSYIAYCVSECHCRYSSLYRTTLGRLKFFFLFYCQSLAIHNDDDLSQSISVRIVQNFFLHVIMLRCSTSVSQTLYLQCKTATTFTLSFMSPFINLIITTRCFVPRPSFGVTTVT